MRNGRGSIGSRIRNATSATNTDNFFITRGESANQPDQIEAQVRGASGANGVRINLVNNIFRGVGGTQGKGIVEGSLGGASSLNTIGRNVYDSLLTKVALLASSQLSWVDTVEGVTFANLPASPGQGSLLLCTDCARTTPCTAGSAGANVFAFYTGTQWDCHVRPPGLNNQIAQSLKHLGTIRLLCALRVGGEVNLAGDREL